MSPCAPVKMGASQAQAITPASFAAGVVFCTAAGTILAMVLARRAANPARAFLRTSLILVAVSLVFPLAACHTATSTRLKVPGAGPPERPGDGVTDRRGHRDPDHHRPPHPGP